MMYLLREYDELVLVKLRLPVHHARVHERMSNAGGEESAAGEMKSN